MSEITPCDPEVKAHELVVCTLEGSSEKVEAWVVKLREMSGSRLDWSFGIVDPRVASVLHMGDDKSLVRAIKAIWMLKCDAPGAIHFYFSSSNTNEERQLERRRY